MSWGGAGTGKSFLVTWASPAQARAKEARLGARWDRKVVFGDLGARWDRKVVWDENLGAR